MGHYQGKTSHECVKQKYEAPIYAKLNSKFRNILS